MAVRLCNENLSQVPSFFSVPKYDRSSVSSGILHLGPSSFARAHIAVYADRLLHKQHEAGQPLTWGITAVSMRSSDVRDDIASQDYLYTLTGKGKGREEGRVIGSIRDILIARENPEAVLEAAADPNIKVLSLTVTQEGYYYKENGAIDFEHKDIKADLERSDINEAQSSIGVIVAALNRRRERGIAPPTVLSCDNLPNNGGILRGAVLAYAARRSPELHEWISQHVEFPITMVDRITPGKTGEHIAYVADKGVLDARPVEAEMMPGMPFVIQNRISRDPATGENVEFPDFAAVGAVVDEEVAPYELLKLRTVNGAHMAMGCIGHVAGFKFSSEAISDEDMFEFIQGFKKEVGQTLLPTELIDQDEYRRDVMTRLQNDQIADPLTRLARNGSKDKVQGRLADPLRECINDASRTHGHLTFALAAWIEYLKTLESEGYLKGVKYFDSEGQQLNTESPDYVSGAVRYDAQGKKAEPNDKKAADIGLLKYITPDLVDPAPILTFEELRLNGLGKNRAVQEEVGQHLVAIRDKGMRQALADFVREHSAPAASPVVDGAHQRAAADAPKPLLN